QSRVRQEAKETQPIVDGDDNGRDAKRPAGGQLASVVIPRCSIDVTSAVNPHNNREAAGCRGVPVAELRCEDVQVKAVLVHARRTGEHTKRRRLRTDAAETSRIPRLLPFRNGLRRHPAPFARGRSGIGNAEEFINTIPNETSDGTLGCPYKRPCLVARG